MDAMNRFDHPKLCWLLLAGAVLLAGCSSSAGSLITGSAEPNPENPGSLSNENPLARPMAVAWTSARAEKCGFYFDPVKLRASYLAYEAKQANPEQLGRAQHVYDTTFKSIGQRIATNPDYCTSRKSDEIKADLQRHLAGDFSPKLPQPKKVESCGLFGCSSIASEEKWDTEKWWSDEAKKRMGR
jgi:hypothetical protein